MTSIGTSSALLLAVVFATAAFAKLRSPAEVAASFARLRVPAPALLSRLVPVAEVTLAGLLVWAPRTGSAVALLALAAFSIVLERARGGGVRAGCACFGGSRRDAPLSGALLRNGLLGVAAVCGLAGERGWVDVPAVVVVSTAALLGLVLLALWELRTRTGTLWDNRVDRPGQSEGMMGQ